MSQNLAERIPGSMTLEQCYEAILQCLMLGVAGHYRIGQLYNHIVVHRLALNQGYPTTRAYFRRHVRVLSHRALTMYGAVAHHFTLAEVEQYGLPHLGALLDYLRLARIWIWKLDRKDLGGTPIEIPRRGGLKITKRFADCTSEDMRAAIQARRAWPGHGPLEPEAAPVERYVETLGRHFKENSRFPPEIDAQVNNRLVQLRVRHLRVWELGRLTEALERTLVPVPAPEPMPAPAPAPPGEEAAPAPLAQIAGVISSFK